ncbi:hypothetical protein E2C01_067274 [Portunus trituberculatus]|uniref:Uncharacterized protein n=1 Tax=Portunus trituberculatus TaxID=210409 RepID=A0A5B7HW85_PORTR|nr:hypothetical protein [Portunus trituberculatus]
MWLGVRVRNRDRQTDKRAVTHRQADQETQPWRGQEDSQTARKTGRQPLPHGDLQKQTRRGEETQTRR